MASVAQLNGVSSHTPKGNGFDFPSTYPGCGFNPRSGSMGKQLMDVSLSLPSSSKSNQSTNQSNKIPTWKAKVKGSDSGHWVPRGHPCFLVYTDPQLYQGSTGAPLPSGPSPQTAAQEDPTCCSKSCLQTGLLHLSSSPETRHPADIRATSRKMGVHTSWEKSNIKEARLKRNLGQQQSSVGSDGRLTQKIQPVRKQWDGKGWKGHRGSPSRPYVTPKSNGESLAAQHCLWGWRVKALTSSSLRKQRG